MLPKNCEARAVILHTKTYGTGERIYLGVHGWGAEHRKSFSELIAQLDGHDVALVGVDLPGCGESPELDDWSWDAVTRALVETIDTIEPDKKLNLIGSCSGSFHVLEAALARPERVEQLILLEPFAFMPWYFSIFLTPIAGLALYHSVFNNPIGKAITSLNMRRNKLNEDYDMVGAFANGMDIMVPYRYLGYYDAIPGHEVYAGVDAPVRIIYGANTFGAVRESVNRWRENWPTLDAHALEGVGHMISQEAPDRVAALIFAPAKTAARAVA